MRFSRFGVLAFIAFTVLLGANCSYYNRVMARKNLVDGAKAYKDRKFPEAEARFRYAASLDPNGDTVEGRTAQLSLARTLHSEYIGNRQNKGMAQSALDEYKKSLPPSLKELKETSAGYEKSPNSEDAQRKYYQSLSAVNSSSSAIASLYENLAQPDQAKAWQNEVAANNDYPPTARARALSAVAARANTCANEISDTDATKKTIQKDGKDAFQFVKPANPQDFETMKQCVAEGLKFIEQAAALEPPQVKTADTIDIKKISDTEIELYLEIFKVFESARSYKASLTVQAMRAAEMEGNNAERDRLKAEAETAKENFKKLSDIVKKLQTEKDERIAAKEEATKTEAAKNANAKK